MIKFFKRKNLTVPVIWLFYKYFQKKDDSPSLVGSPPNWPG